jgi:hypothetical protein
MRIAMVMLAGLMAQAAFAAPRQFARITVCVERHPAVAEAEPVAWSIFHSVGVTIEWHGIRACPADGIVVTLRAETPANMRPGSLACALPYEGTHIEVFFDRIQRFSRDQPSPVLAHVLVHEITHILQGVARHSESGIMKADFTAADFRQMQVKPLPFTADDIDMIRMGVQKREAAHVAAAAE